MNAFCKSVFEKMTGKPYPETSKERARLTTDEHFLHLISLVLGGISDAGGKDPDGFKDHIIKAAIWAWKNECYDGEKVLAYFKSLKA